MKLEPLNKRGELSSGMVWVDAHVWLMSLVLTAKQATATKAESNQQLSKPVRTLFDKVGVSCQLHRFVPFLTKNPILHRLA
jgi:hypothetical protein